MKKKLLTITVTAAMVLPCGLRLADGGSNETRRWRQISQKQQLRVLFLKVMVKNTESRCNNRFSAQEVWILQTTGMDGLCPFYGISENLFRLDNLAPQPWLVDSYGEYR